MVVALGTAYLAGVGVIGGERSGFLAYTGITGIAEYRGTVPPFVLRIGLYTRDLFTADWVSWPVLLWFVGLLLFIFLRDRRRVPPARQERRADRNDRSRRNSSGREEAAAAQGRQKPPGGELPLAAAGGIVLMGALFALFAAALSVQPVWILTNPVADLRYYMGALPLLLALKGLFAEWAWRRWKPAGAAVAAVLLCSSAGAWPFNLSNVFSGERTLALHLFQFVREIHRPYRDSIRVVSDYLLEHAAQDDLVYVPGFADREALTFTTGHRVLFCCVLGEDSPLPPATVESLDARLFIAGTTPDWIVLFREAVGGILGQGQAAIRRGRASRRVLLSDAAARDQRARVHAVAVAGAGRAHPAAQIRGQAVPGGRGTPAAAALRGSVGDLPGGAGDRPRAHPRAGRRGPGRCSPWSATRRRRTISNGPCSSTHGTRKSLDYLALVRFRQERYETALDLYRRLVEVSPDNAQAHANMGATLYYLGRLDEAARSFEHALSLHPGLETARSGLEGIRKSLAREAP